MINTLALLGYFLRVNPWILVVLGAWDIVWRGMALWKSAQHNQRSWFVALMIVNSIGILPIVYLYFFQKKLIEKTRKRKKA